MDFSWLVLRLKREIKVQNESVAYLGTLCLGLGYLTDILERKDRNNILGVPGGF